MIACILVFFACCALAGFWGETADDKAQEIQSNSSIQARLQHSRSSSTAAGGSSSRRRARTQNPQTAEINHDIVYYNTVVNDGVHPSKDFDHERLYPAAA